MKPTDLKGILFFLLLVSQTSCAQQVTPPVKTNDKVDIKELIGLSCTSNTQCKTIGYGDSPCGGYASYLVYSTADTDEAILKKEVAKYNALDKAKNKKEGIVGICRHIPAPATRCKANICVATNNQLLELK